MRIIILKFFYFLPFCVEVTGLSDVTGLDGELDYLKAVINIQGEQIVSLSAKINKLNSDLMNIARPETFFKYKLPNISQFFRVYGNTRYSGRFWCRGVQWSIKVERVLRDRVKYLGLLLLHCYHNDPLKWSCKVNFKLILFNHLSETQNRTSQFFETFRKHESLGDSYFISYRELTDKENGYIQDDKVVLGVEMKAEPIVRESLSDPAV